jgi:excisionase family DNA binding protein
MKKLVAGIPRIALTPAEAAASIGVGPDFFEANIAPELRLIRRGRKRLIPVTELERWVAENAVAAVVDEIDGQKGTRFNRPPSLSR